ncbi:MAG: OmpH family outer membrane protein [Saprospiraceae bacterium]|nr:OmpH family outer membrane protein [Saprospiraceae bacterium]
MKSLPWIIVGILTLALANLYFKVYDKTGTGTKASVAADGSGLRIVYVNADSVLENYTQFRKEKDVLDRKQLDIDTRLGNKGRALENEVNTIQQRIQGGLLTPKEIQEQEQRLGAKQQTLIAERDKLAKEIVDEGTAINDRLQKVLISALEKLKSERGYHYIFSYIKGGQILLGNPADDITRDVLNILNSKDGGMPADSVK